MTIRSRISRLIFGFIFLITSTVASAINGSFDYGFSEITRGMGGSGVALPQDAVIAIINPAGMVWVGHRADLGITAYFPSSYYKATNGVASAPVNTRTLIAGGEHGNGVDVFSLPDFGINWVINDKSSFGLTIASIAGFGSSYTALGVANLPGNVTGPGPFGGGRVLSDYKQALTSLTYSRKITPHSSWGVSLLLAAQTFKNQGFRLLRGLAQDGIGNNLSNRGLDYSVGAGVRAGIMLDPFQWLTVAASYQPEIPMTKFKRYSDIFANHGSLNIPPNIVMGLALHITDDLDVTFDYQDIYFSKVGSYGHSGKAIDEGLCAPTVGGPRDRCLGGPNGAGFGWRDSEAWKFGAQWRATEKWFFRVGYNHSRAVIRKSELALNIIAPGGVVSDLYTAGFTFLVNKFNRLNAFLVWIPLQSVTGINGASAGSQHIRLRFAGMGGGLGWSWILP